MNHGSNLPNDHFILRLVPKRLLRRDENDAVIGILGQGLQLRDGEPALSVCWLEYFNGDKAARIRLSALVKNHSLNVKKNDAFAIANVLKVKEICTDNLLNVRIVYAPEDTIPNHSEIRRYPADNQDLYDLLAEHAFTETIINSNLVAT